LASRFDVIVLGAGAAGLMCAAAASQRGRSVALVDHNPQPGRKILISGGGRCNFTNLHAGPANYLSQNPHFAKSALALYEPRHFVELVERHRIAWHEKTLGQLFCDHSARAILDMLLAECQRGPGSVQQLYDRRVTAVDGGSEGFSLETNHGELRSDALVVATGGLSIPKMGASGFGYDLARQFGMRIVEPRPALVPLVLGKADAAWTELAGISAEVEITTPVKFGKGSGKGGRVRFRENLLFTHRGLSGPAILQASSYWKPGEALEIDFLPSLPANTSLLNPLLQTGARRDAASLLSLLRGELPQRLAQFVAAEGRPEGWSNRALEERERQLRSWSLRPAGTEGFEKAEVTAGGVNTEDLQARTLESKQRSGLFFAGEVVDVTGQLGGYNFQWAWASATAVARAL